MYAEVFWQFKVVVPFRKIAEPLGRTAGIGNIAGVNTGVLKIHVGSHIPPFGKWRAAGYFQSVRSAAVGILIRSKRSAVCVLVRNYIFKLVAGN